MDGRSEFITVSCANHHEKLIGALWNFFLTNRFVDFDIQMGDGQSFRAHRLMLELFLQPEKLEENDACTAEVPDSRTSVDRQNSILALVEFLYKGHVTIGKWQLNDLMSVARKSGFQMLVKAIEAATGKQIKAEEPVDTTENIYTPNPGCEYSDNMSDSEQEDVLKCQQNSKSEIRNSRYPGSNSADSMFLDLRYNDSSGGDGASDTGQRSRSPVDRTIKFEVTVTPDSNRSEAPVDDDDDDTNIVDYRQSARPSAQSPPSTASRLTCDHCDRTFTLPSDLKAHLRSHVSHKRRGSACDRFFVTGTTPTTHHGLRVGETNHKRHPCPKKYVDVLDLSTRCRSKQQEVNKNERELAGQPARPPVPAHHQRGGGSAISHKCNLCGEVFAQLRGLSEHMLTHLQPGSQFLSEARVGKKLFNCELCGRGFTQKISLINHAVTHTGAKPYRCECGAAYSHYSTLYRHRLKLDHGGRKTFKFKCHLCGARYARRDHLDAHVLKCMDLRRTGV